MRIGRFRQQPRPAGKALRLIGEHRLAWLAYTFSDLRAMEVWSHEALRLDLDLIEVPVFGGPPVDFLIPGPAERVLSPSRPGKHGITLYIDHPPSTSQTYLIVLFSPGSRNRGIRRTEAKPVVRAISRLEDS